MASHFVDEGQALKNRGFAGWVWWHVVFNPILLGQITLPNNGVSALLGCDGAGANNPNHMLSARPSVPSDGRAFVVKPPRPLTLSNRGQFLSASWVPTPNAAGPVDYNFQ